MYSIPCKKRKYFLAKKNISNGIRGNVLCIICPGSSETMTLGAGSTPIFNGVSEMYQDDEEDKTIYKVVVNHEEQYSIWPAERENPLGWRDVGKSGLKPECLAYIKEVWTDMRPLSLRKRMEEIANQSNS
jgi:MbtH protein